jgi:putative DNA primase/helicase
MGHNIGRSRFGLTNVPGKTLLTAAEQPAGYIETTHILNTLISGERIIIEEKYKHPVEVVPHAKICWAMNDLPRINGANNGLFRRVKVVEFPYLAENLRDPSLKGAIKAEGAGILNWALDGLRRLTERGDFDIPDRVGNATKEFQEMNDVEAAFLKEKYGDDKFSTQAKYHYSDYSIWCENNGYRPKSLMMVAQDWKRLGLTSSIKNGRVFWSRT